MKTRIRSGFTLVELLVVIAIIGMLMALLLPAVNSAKESGRRAVCLNNQKQLAVAMTAYDSKRGEVPGFANGVGKTSSADVGRLATWVVMLFPHLEREDVYSKWSDSTNIISASNPLPMPYVELLVCPSNLPESTNVPALAYVANCGVKDPGLKTSPPAVAVFATTTTPPKNEKAANGLLFNHYDPPTAGTFMQISMSLGKIPDGASNTLMLTENTAAYHYTDEQNTSSATTYKQYASAPNAECGTGFVWNPLETTPRPTVSPAEQINGSGPPETKKFSYQIGYMNGVSNFGSAQSYWFARPSSLHSGGVNAAFCDGGVRFLRDDIDYNVYQQLMTTDGAHSDLLNKSYVLQDSDYK